MSLGINFLGRQWPTNTSQALRNMKNNMRSTWKVTRLGTSTLMSVVAAALLSACIAGVDENDSTSTDSSVSLTPFLFDFTALNPAGKFCLVGGCVYGVCSIANFVIVVVKCIERMKVLQRGENGRNVQPFTGNMLACVFSEIVASIINVEYAVFMVMQSVSKPSRSSIAIAIKAVRGGLSVGVYVLDVSLALGDLICLDVEERDREEAERRRRLNVVLGWPRHPNGGEGMPMMVMPPQNQDLGAMRGRG